MNALDYLMKKVVRHHDGYAAYIAAWTIVAYNLTFVYYTCLTGMNSIINRIGCILIAAVKTKADNKPEIAARLAGNRQIGKIVKQYYVVINTAEI